jgi:hypothetical protein
MVFINALVAYINLQQQKLTTLNSADNKKYLQLAKASADIQLKLLCSNDYNSSPSNSGNLRKKIFFHLSLSEIISGKSL